MAHLIENRLTNGLGDQFAVDRESEIPIGTQLAWRLKALIAAGRAEPGSRLPGVRELAEAAGVNVNTARAVYRRLEEDGYLVSRHGAGTFVADALPASTGLEQIAADAVEEARSHGLDPDALAAAVHAAASFRPAPADSGSRISSTPLPRIDTDERDARGELRRQIARLEAELGRHVETAPRPESRHPLLQPKGHLAGVEELESIRDELLERLERTRDSEGRRAARERAARARIEDMVADPSQHRWAWVSAEDTGDPGCKHWQVRPRYGLLGAVFGWWRVKVSSGCPLAGASGGGAGAQDGSQG